MDIMIISSDFIIGFNHVFIDIEAIFKGGQSISLLYTSIFDIFGILNLNYVVIFVVNSVKLVTDSQLGPLIYFLIKNYSTGC